MHVQPFHHLDTLWIQVAGTQCNLSCAHCFVPSGPGVTRHAMLARADVAARVAEAVAMGVKEIYFTGGEPFLNAELEAIVEDTLAVAPVTVLTNGTLFTARRVTWLAATTRTARYSLELRVSLDGVTAAAHDALRGAGAWSRTMDGLRALSAAGLLPIVTVTQLERGDALQFRERVFDVLRAEGLAQPRVKVLPLFKLGREAERAGAYGERESLALLPAGAFDADRLQCGACRAVTSQGVFVCPLLVDEPAARMGDTLAESARGFELSHGACHTCWVTGMTCANG
ncbi:MAG: radical SAM protein [Candidatus Eisenbacteria bacterium]